MNTEPLEVTGVTTLDIDPNGVILGPANNQVEVPEPSPVDVLLNAKIQAVVLANAGADSNIQYSATKAAISIDRLLRDMERHRRIVGGSR